MPVEIREIIFSNPELSAAVINFLKIREDNPYDAITHVSVTKDRRNPVSFSAIAKATDERVSKTLTDSEVAAALLIYCRHNKIAIPRDGKKSVEINKEGYVVLKVRHVSGQAAQTSSSSSLGT